MPGYELIGKEEKEAINDIFDKGGILSRSGFDKERQRIFRVDNFEKEMAKKLGVKYALCVSSGTAALKLALIGLGVKAGDEVITQSFTFVATVEAILELGATPVITEIDKSLNMDPKDLEKKITPKTKAIIPVHMAGVPAKMSDIIAIAEKHNIPVLEDSAQALGAAYKTKPMGTIGDVGIYSFDVGKIITMGEGGMLVTNNEETYLRARQYTDHGHEYNPTLPRGNDTRTTWGFNYKATEIHGAMGLAQMKKMDYIIQKQRENKKMIKDGIKNIENIEFREIPDEKGDTGDTLIFFVETREKAKQFAKLLAEKELGTKNLPDAISWHYAGMWTHIFHDSPEYNGKNLEEVWSQSTRFLERAIAIPIMVKMSDEQISYWINAIKEISERIGD